MFYALEQKSANASLNKLGLVMLLFELYKFCWFLKKNYNYFEEKMYEGLRFLPLTRLDPL